MKKGLKNLAWGLAILPLGLLSACGDQLSFNSGINVNSAGAYKVSTAGEFTEYTNSVQEENMSFSGYKMIYNMAIENGDSMAELKMNAILVANQEKTSFQGAIKLEATAEGEYMNMKMYLPETDSEHIYVDISSSGSMEINGQMKIPFDLTGGDFGPVEQALSMASIDVSQLFEEIATASDVSYEKAESGNKVNYKVEYNSYDLNHTYYICFENGVLQGVLCESDGIYISIERFEGEVNYPNFSNYKESTEGLI